LSAAASRTNGSQQAKQLWYIQRQAQPAVDSSARGHVLHATSVHLEKVSAQNLDCVGKNAACEGEVLFGGVYTARRKMASLGGGALRCGVFWGAFLFTASGARAGGGGPCRSPCTGSPGARARSSPTNSARRPVVARVARRQGYSGGGLATALLGLAVNGEEGPLLRDSSRFRGAVF
jgi:hypothetical protein